MGLGGKGQGEEAGKPDAAQQLHQQCLAILQDPALAGSDTRLERAILSWSMGATVCMADYAQGRERFEESFSLFRALDHRWGMAWALNAFCTMSKFLGELQDARQRFEEALALYRALGDPWGMARAIVHLGRVAYLLSEYGERKNKQKAKKGDEQTHGVFLGRLGDRKERQSRMTLVTS